MSKRKLDKEGKGVGQRAMRRQEKRVATDHADYQLNQAAKDFVSLNPGLDCNEPKNIERAWKNFIENFSPNNPSQKLRKFVFTPTLSSTNSRTLRVFLFALIAAGMVTRVNAEVFQENLGRDLIGGGEDSVPAPKPSAPLPPSSPARARSGMVTKVNDEVFQKNLRRDLIGGGGDPVPTSTAPTTLPSVPARARSGNLRRRSPAPTLPSSSEPAARELPAKPIITQAQLTDYVNDQRDSANPTKMISLEALAGMYRTDPSGLLLLPEYITNPTSSTSKLSLSNVDFSRAKVAGIFFKGVDLSGAKMTGQKFGYVSFEDSQLDRAQLDRSAGSIRIYGQSSVKGASFAAAAITLGVFANVNEGTFADFTDASFEGAVLDQKRDIVSDRASVVGLNLTGATVTVPTASGTTESVDVKNPLVIGSASSDTLKRAANPGAALQTGAADRPIEVKLQSDAEKCGDTSSAVSPVELEEFAKTLNERFSGNNIAATTNDSELAGSVRSEITLCKDSVSSASVFPQLQTRISFDSSLSPQEAQIQVAQSVFRALGMKADAAQIQGLTYKMYDLDHSEPLPLQNSSYPSVMQIEFLGALAGEDPALAGCTLSVGLHPGEFKIVARDVELVVDPKICDEGNEFGFKCRFNQKAYATSRVPGNNWQIRDMDVSLNTIEKDGEVVGYTIAVDGMTKVDGAIAGDSLSCPATPPSAERDDSAGPGTIALASIFGLGLVCLIGACIREECKKKRTGGAHVVSEHGEIEMSIHPSTRPGGVVAIRTEEEENLGIKSR